jgi:hypothetical protein
VLDPFASHASDTDKLVAKKVPGLVAKLQKIRASIEAEILGLIGYKKATSDSEAPLDATSYHVLRSAVDAVSAASYSDAIYDSAEVLVSAGWEGAKSLLSLSTGFDVLPVWALESVKDSAAHVGKLVTDRDKAKLTQVLESAFLNGDSASDTAEALRVAFSDGITTVLTDGGLRTAPSESWFTTVARTELQRAAVDGQTSLYAAAGVQTVRWQAAEPCDECAEADDVVMPLGEDFPGVDVDQPPAHPNCRCVLVPADEDLGSHRGTDEERALARNGNNPE